MALNETTITEQVASESISNKAQESKNIIWARVQGYPWWPVCDGLLAGSDAAVCTQHHTPQPQAQRMPLEAAEKHTGLASAARKKGQDTPVMFFGAAEVAWVTATEQCAWDTGISKRFHLQTRLLKRFTAALVQLVHLLEYQHTPPGWYYHTGNHAAPPPPPPRAPKRSPPAADQPGVS